MVVKCPRFAFEKFRTAKAHLTTQMQSVGESMAIGRTFKEAFQKGLRALEIGRSGWEVGPRLIDDRLADDSLDTLRSALRQPTPERVFQVIDPWFLEQMRELIDAEKRWAALSEINKSEMRRMKRMGFSDRQLGDLRGVSEGQIRAERWEMDVRPSYKMVDTCAGEFPSATPYLYGSYDEESEAPRSGRKSIVILGSGPNRIGQGVEFDYCCVRASLALREQGFETIMINSNPETVSTDFDISDKLYFEPLTLEHVLEIVDREQPVGVIVQLGGQTPLKLTRGLEAAGVPILGTSPDAIDIAEDRQRFDAIARKLNEKGKLSNNAVAEGIINNVRKTIIRDQLTDPRFYAEMSKLLDDLIKQSRADASAYEEFLKEAEELVKRMANKDAVTGVPAILHGKREAVVIYNNLYDILAGGTSMTREETPIERGERSALALRIDQAMRENAPAGWKGDDIREKQVLNALFPIMSRDRQATLALFEIIKNQPGYG